MSYQEGIDERLGAALILLNQQQAMDGSFISQSSTYTDFHIHEKKHTVYYTAAILLALEPVASHPKAQNIIRKGVDFLLSQQTERGTFNYWANTSKEIKELSYPNDLDDTCLALAAIITYRRTALTGELLAKLTETLIALELKPGGPYKTWILPAHYDAQWHDVDLAVNANIDFLLKRLDIKLKGLEEYFTTKIFHKRLHSVYYATVESVIYFLARTYQGDCHRELQTQILRSLVKNRNHNPLQLTLLAASIAHISPVTTTTTSILNQILSLPLDSVILPYPYIIEHKKQGVIQYSGSPSLTLALYIEAMARLKEHIHEKNNQKELDKPTELYDQITTSVAERCTAVFADMREPLITNLAKTIQNDRQRTLCLTAYHVAQDAGQQIPDELIKKIGYANLFSWMGFSLYDDLIDGDADTQSLPILHFCIREALISWQKLFPDRIEWQKTVQSMFDKIDAAYTWELVHARKNMTLALNSKDLPEQVLYKKIILRRSSAHALSALAILMHTDETTYTEKAHQIIIFFQNIYYARQICDDLHDWLEDIKIGHTTMVVADIIRAICKQHNSIVNLTDQTSITTAQLRLHFWETVVPERGAEILDIVTLAASMLRNIYSTSSNSINVTFVAPLKKNIEALLEQRKLIMDFISTYEHQFSH